jgi:hypothetical protein
MSELRSVAVLDGDDIARALNLGDEQERRP